LTSVDTYLCMIELSNGHLQNQRKGHMNDAGVRVGN
jgi:hypothetical protein